MAKDPENTKDPAKRNGFRAEAVVADALTRAGCEFGREVSRGLSIFGTRLHADFFVRNLPAFPDGLAIECKYQAGPGTADEKICFVIENVRNNGYLAPTLLIVDGAGFRRVRTYLTSCAADIPALVGVPTMAEFEAWLLSMVTGGA